MEGVWFIFFMAGLFLGFLAGKTDSSETKN